MNLDNYLTKLKEKKETSGGASSEWQEIIGELTDFLNEHRGQYGPWNYQFIAQKVAYIKKAGLPELRLFRDRVKEKGSWFFWWITKQH